MEKNRLNKGLSGSSIGVIGAGAWGTTLAKILAERGYPVDIWCYEGEVAKEINTNSTNSKYLIGVKLPTGLKAYKNLEPVLRNKDFLFIVIPSLYLKHTITKLKRSPSVKTGKSLIGVLTKGFIEVGGEVKLIIDVLEKNLSSSYKGNLVYISGPSHAEEVARGKITGLISASCSGINAIRFRELLSSERLIVFSSLDVIGVQVSAAVKNVVAVAFGMLDALREFSDIFGDNTESLLLAAGLNEIQKLGTALGSTHPETFTSIAGVGDLDVSCRSSYGRNRRFGRDIIIARVLNRYTNLVKLLSDLPRIGYVPEGLIAARCAYKLARKFDLDLPISLGVYRILNRETDPIEELESMLKRITRVKNLSFLPGRE